jgi:hypothetical protein
MVDPGEFQRRVMTVTGACVIATNGKTLRRSHQTKSAQAPILWFDLRGAPAVIVGV